MADDQNGFEWKNRVYSWSVSDIGKDLMLIDRIARMPPSDFMELLDDTDENQRAPVLLALIATSLRAGHPDWSVERIYRIVMNLSLTQDVTFIAEEGDDESPPPEAGQPTSEPGRSPSNGSSPPSTPQEPSTSPTSSATPP